MDYEQKTRLLKALLEQDCLKFGSFTTKSGMKTPYFVNIGNLATGGSLSLIAELFCKKLLSTYSPDFPEHFFGPAYKGIPLAAAASMAWHQLTGREISYSYNRKESKDHGEKGIFVGSLPSQNVRTVITEDILTRGTSARESLQLLKTRGQVNVKTLLVVVDREEIHPGTNKSVATRLVDELRIDVLSLLKISEILELLENEETLKKCVDRAHLEALKKHISDRVSLTKDPNGLATY